jgi:hypothetical protein
MRQSAFPGLMVAWLLAVPGWCGEPAATEVDVTGEIVDLHCYLTRGAKGADHAGCANACLGRGVTPALLAKDGRLLMLLGERPFPIKEMIAGLAGEDVTVTGAMVQRDGVRALLVKSVRKAGR